MDPLELEQRLEAILSPMGARLAEAAQLNHDAMLHCCQTGHKLRGLQTQLAELYESLGDLLGTAEPWDPPQD